MNNYRLQKKADEAISIVEDLVLKIEELEEKIESLNDKIDLLEAQSEEY